MTVIFAKTCGTCCMSEATAFASPTTSFRPRADSESERTRFFLIDMKLSKEDGGQRVYEIVRQSNPAARVILITGFRTEMNRPVQRLVAEGADAVSYKPFDLPDLLATLKRLAS